MFTNATRALSSNFEVGHNSFTDAKLKANVSESTYGQVTAGGELSKDARSELAVAVKEWAFSVGAINFAQ